MAIVKKISELTPKGSALGNTDLLIVGVDNGTDYDLKSVTGAQVLGNIVSQTITDGITTKAPSENVVFDALALKVDKVLGKGLSTEDYTTAEKSKLAGLSGTNTGDQTLQQVTDKGNITNNQLVSTAGVFFKTGSNQTLSSLYSTDSNTKGALLLGDLIGNSTYYKLNEITVNSNSILLPTSAGTLALTSDLTSKVTSNTAIIGATKTKITYDSKGLVTSGADATTSDIADSLNKRYVTDANLTTIGNTSGTNTGDQDLSSYATNSSVVKLTGDQTVGGIKTLTNELKLNDKLYLSETAAPAAMTGYTTLTSNGSQFLLQNGSSTAAATFVFSGARTYTLPNITGTLLASTNNLSDLTDTTTARTNLGLGSLATQSGTFSGTSSGTNTGDQTFLDARIQSVTSSATVTPISTNDLVKVTAQAVGLTLANPTGTFTEGQALMIRIKDNGTARTIAFDTNYRAIGVTLPTTTVISKTMYLGIIYNSTDSKWDIVGYNIQA